MYNMYTYTYTHTYIYISTKIIYMNAEGSYMSVCAWMCACIIICTNASTHCMAGGHCMRTYMLPQQTCTSHVHYIYAPSKQ